MFGGVVLIGGVLLICVHGAPRKPQGIVPRNLQMLVCISSSGQVNSPAVQVSCIEVCSTP